MVINRIVVIGSSNTDMVIKTSKLPVPGETILGGNFFMNPGGKRSQSGSGRGTAWRQGQLYRQNGG